MNNLNIISQQIKDYLTELLAEEALDYPDHIINTNGISRKETIKKLISIIYAKRSHQSFTKNKSITIRYYHNNPCIYNDYNECDTAWGKQRLSSFEYDKPFVEEIHIIRH